MEIDLAAAEAPIEAIRSQVCVIGAGIAGLTLAQKLTRQRQGIDVVLLEAGGHDIEDDGQHLFAAAQLNGHAMLERTKGAFACLEARRCDGADSC